MTIRSDVGAKTRLLEQPIKELISFNLNVSAARCQMSFLYGLASTRMLLNIQLKKYLHFLHINLSLLTHYDVLCQVNFL